MFNRKAPDLMGISMVSGFDFPNKTNPLMMMFTYIYYDHDIEIYKNMFVEWGKPNNGVP